MAASISVFSGHMRTAALSSSARPARLARQRCIVRASSDEVPPNVAEARAWIAAWRAKQQGAPAPSPGASGNGKKAPKAAKAKPAAAAAPAPAANKFGAAQAMADGTLVFTADQLKSVNYSDVLKKK